MVKDEIENLRKCLNDMLSEYDFDNKEVLNISRKLDILILNYLKKSMSEKIT